MQEIVKSLKPTTLKKGDTIGLAPLAGPFQEKPYQRGITILREHGFQVKTLQTSGEKPYLAGSDEERLAIFHELWDDTKVAAILATRGGYGTIRILDSLNFDRIRKQPKPLIGFSDISGFTNVITQRTGLITFHGPNLTTLNQCDKESLSTFFHTLSRLAPFDVEAPIEVLRNGTSQGILAGGNLTTINHLLGTPYELNFDNKIVILEEISEAPYAVDRLFYQLYLSGKLRNLQGLILGDFSRCGPIENIWQMILELLHDTTYPIWGNFPVGHGEKNSTWPIGATVSMDSNNSRLSYMEQVMTR